VIQSTVIQSSSGVSASSVLIKSSGIITPVLSQFLQHWVASTTAGFKLSLWEVIIKEQLLKVLSDSSDIAGLVKMSVAMRERRGY
jgi:hypothetical protein